MNTFKHSATALAIAFSLAATTAAAANLIDNGNFESTELDKWASADSTKAIVNDATLSSNVLKITTRTASNATAKYTLENLEKNKSYKVTAKIKSAEG